MDETNNITPPSGVGGLKRELRRHIRHLKGTYTPEQLTELSHQLCAKVLELPQWRNASTVLLYNALPDEVKTQDLINAARKEKKRILLPVVVGDDIILKEDTGKYVKGPFGILEPTGPKINLQDILKNSPFGGWGAFIPGMAFDHHNNRLGRGKGYYDRLLNNLNISKISSPLGESEGVSGFLVGLCFPFQYVPTIPTEPHDIPMDIVIH